MAEVHQVLPSQFLPLAEMYMRKLHVKTSDYLFQLYRIPNQLRIILRLRTLVFIVGCRGDVLLGVLYLVLLAQSHKVQARKSFLFSESSLVLKIKNTWLILHKVSVSLQFSGQPLSIAIRKNCQVRIYWYSQCATFPCYICGKKLQEKNVYCYGADQSSFRVHLHWQYISRCSTSLEPQA